MRTALSRRAGGVWLDLLKGVLAAVAVTAALVILFALLISLFSVSDGAIRTVNQIIKLAAIVAGVCVAARRGDARGLARGAAVGLIYMAAGVLLYAALTAQRLTASAYAADLLMGVAAGGLTGMLRSRT